MNLSSLCYLDEDVPKMQLNLLPLPLSHHLHRFYVKQLENSLAKWSLKDQFRVPYDEVLKNLADKRLSATDNPTEEEDCLARVGPIVVDGVYLHLYVACPGWQLRRPEPFLDSLLAQWVEVCFVSPPSALMILI